ncbi:MAG: LexA family transcriptional regulator [Bacteroidota bacterium]
MEYIHTNLKFLRKSKEWTQEEFADKLKIKRSLLGAYEEGRAKPNYEVLVHIAKLFEVSLENLITKNLEKHKAPKKAISNMKVLSITVDKEGNENIEIVPVKAAAGYLNGYADPEYLQELKRFSLPFLSKSTYRAFEIKGDSMSPLPSGSIVVGEYVEHISDIKDGQTYVLVSKNEGIVYKRIFNKVEENETLILRSDNLSYEPYTIKADEVLEIWKAVVHLSYANKGSESSFQNIVSLMQDMKEEIESLKKDKHTLN